METCFISFLLSCFSHFTSLLFACRSPFILPSYFLHASILLVIIDSSLLTHFHQWLWEYDVNINRRNSLILVLCYHFNICFVSSVISFITSKKSEALWWQLGFYVSPDLAHHVLEICQVYCPCAVFILRLSVRRRTWKCLKNLISSVSIFSLSPRKAPASLGPGFSSPFCSVSTTHWLDEQLW